jgi:hydroxymethylbilane synthase
MGENLKNQLKIHRLQGICSCRVTWPSYDYDYDNDIDNDEACLRGNPILILTHYALRITDFTPYTSRQRVKSMNQRTLRIGTRGSMLALWQANWVKDRLEERHANLRVKLVEIRTQGDRILDVPLAKVGGKGLFVKEIEEALLAGEVDLAVHSMKDVPTVLPPGLELRCTTEREDVRDVVVLRQGLCGFTDLPPGAKIGTSSLRRKAQLLYHRPDLEIADLRGNVETRLRKLTEEGFDGIVLAAAGLKRLGFENRISEFLSEDFCVPAIGQGALGLECRADDAETHALLDFLHHPATGFAVVAERAFLHRLEGGCQVPVAAHGLVQGDRLKLVGLVASPDGSRMVRDQFDCLVSEAERTGAALAEELLRRGAAEILTEVYGRAPRPA